MPFKAVDPDELRSLTEVFRRAGARDPESWAHSQLAQGIPQLAIFSFAKALWHGVIREDDESWIDIEVEWANKNRNSNAPCTQMGSALREMISKGVSRSAINDLVRVVQYLALFHASSILDGSRLENVPVTDWTLHQVDETGNPVAVIQGLHEVLLSMDPTGREMRPRGSSS
jgi:hypothetical protein